jgi:hypothetical protein
MIINLESDVTAPLPVLYSMYARHWRKKFKSSGTAWPVNRLSQEMMHRMNHFLLDQEALVSFSKLCKGYYHCKSPSCSIHWLYPPDVSYDMTSCTSACCCLVKEEMVYPIHLVYTRSAKANQKLTCMLFVCVQCSTDKLQFQRYVWP